MLGTVRYGTVRSASNNFKLVLFKVQRVHVYVTSSSFHFVTKASP
jgi:hypothetical protein